jgi:hypothetical protein
MRKCEWCEEGKVSVNYDEEERCTVCGGRGEVTFSDYPIGSVVLHNDGDIYAIEEKQDYKNTILYRLYNDDNEKTMFALEQEIIHELV